MNRDDTAMAKTVGLPLSIAARHVMNGTFSELRGVQIPMKKAIYEPLLSELAEYGVKFDEFRRELPADAI